MTYYLQDVKEDTKTASIFLMDFAMFDEEGDKSIGEYCWANDTISFTEPVAISELGEIVSACRDFRENRPEVEKLFTPEWFKK